MLIVFFIVLSKIKNMKKITISFTIDQWIDSALNEIAAKSNKSKSFVINFFLKKQLNELGFSKNDDFLNEVKKMRPNKVNDDTQLLG